MSSKNNCKFKAAVRTDVTQPSQSLIKSICYPKSALFTSVATEWGCTHEKHALAKYEAQERQKHSDFRVCDSGLVLSTEYTIQVLHLMGLPIAHAVTRGYLK